MKPICMVAHFRGEDDNACGQVVKTDNLYNQLIKSGLKIDTIGTYNAHKRLLILLYQCIKAAIKYDNIIILPAHNGVKFFIPLFALLSTLFKFKLHYIVVGGWLPGYLKKYNWLLESAKKIDFIYVETEIMKDTLSELGLDNLLIMRNFKDIKSINKEELNSCNTPPYKLCTFSRIVEEKGIAEAISIVEEINKEASQTLYTLDIYGSVGEDYKDEFNKILEPSSENITYKGIINPEDSVDTIKDYFLLLFPTKFATEGHPGTILDSYNAGVPVLASEWNSCFDIIDKDKTGLTFKLNDFDRMKQILIDISKNPDIVNLMRESCLEKADEFKPEKVVKILTDRLGD